MATSNDLRDVFSAGRPLIEQWLDIAEQMAALRDAASAKGLDWSQVKALLKAQIQDERDEAGDGKRVRRIVEKAEFASAYADMLGLANMNENNFSAEGPISRDYQDRFLQNSNSSGLETPPPETTDESPAQPLTVPGSNMSQIAASNADHAQTDDAVQSGDESTATPSAMSARTKADVMRLLRPHCQHPDDTEKCGGQGTKHCQACIKAAAESEVA